MTAQWQDQYVDALGNTLGKAYMYSSFDPENFGLGSLDSITTACRRGYVCEYVVDSNKCFLNRLLIKMKPTVIENNRCFVSVDQYPTINGILPTESAKFSHVAYYEHIGLEINCLVSDLLNFLKGEDKNTSIPLSFSNPFNK